MQTQKYRRPGNWHQPFLQEETIMKYQIRLLRQYLPWLLLLLGVDAFALLLLWLSDTEAFLSLSVITLLGSLLFFTVLCCALARFAHKKEQAFLTFLENPDEYHEELLFKASSPNERDSARLLGTYLRNMQNSHAALAEQISDYEEYVESWAHEIKTPLSLLTLLLDNRREELPPAIAGKLDHLRNHLQESVDQMLFYARLKSARKDYLFESISIRSCVEERLEDYKPLLEEKHFIVQCSLSEDQVYSDQRGLRFLLGQIISNAVKYCGTEPELCIRSYRQDDRYVVSIKDNGIGVKSCDLPYIFEKGFTGDSGESRKKATGMGLYLAREIAKELNISLRAASEWGNGFEMQLLFPVIADISQSPKALHDCADM